MKLTLITAALLASSTAFAGDYKIDETHSVATFLISHLGFAKLPGRFNEMAGTYSHADDFSSVELSVTVNAASVDTNHGKRDEHLAEGIGSHPTRLPCPPRARLGRPWPAPATRGGCMDRRLVRSLRTTL